MRRGRCEGEGRRRGVIRLGSERGRSKGGWCEDERSRM